MVLPLVLVVLLLLTVLVNGLSATVQQELATTHEEYQGWLIRNDLRNALEQYWADIQAQGIMVEPARRTAGGICLNTRVMAARACHVEYPMTCQGLEVSARDCGRSTNALELRRGGWWITAGSRHFLMGQYWRWHPG